jgi:uncharacterized protein YfaS (alpha-2-macroglobulin family)
MKKPICKGLIQLLAFVFVWFSFNSTLMAQKQKNYPKLWDKVDSLQEKGLPESALKVVDEIFQKAISENNSEQLVKAAIHQLKFKSWKEEDAVAKNLEALEQHQKTAMFPANAIISSLLADIYWAYYTQNRYRFSNRSATVDYVASDIRTWDLRKLVERVRDKHIEALSHKEKLKTVNLNDLKELIEEGYQSRNLRPTLYDFVAHRAIDFFGGEEPAVIKPAEQFTVNDDSFLANANEFSKFKFTTPDSLSFRYYAISVLQEMIVFHQADADPAALIDVDLKRLTLTLGWSNNPQKDALYLAALQHLEKTYASHESSAEAIYHVALWHYNQGQKYKPLQSSPFQWEIKTALELCDKVMKERDGTPGATNCRSLKSQILSKEITLVSEEVQFPGKPFRVLASYRNVPELFYRVFKTDAEELEKIRDEADNYYKRHKDYKSYDQILIEYFLKKAFVKNGQYKMPQEGDYQKHSAEIGIAGVPAGDYVVMVSDNEKFAFQNGAVSFDITQASNISFIRKADENQNHEFFVLHRETGMPLEGAKVQIWYEVYDYKTYKYKKVNGGLHTTDKNGYIFLAANKEDSRSYFADITWQNDHYFTGNRSTRQRSFYMGRLTEPYNYESYQTTFFTDRSIYRPGQTIYFKGLMIKTDHYKNHSILPNQATTVVFYDVNRKEISRLDVKTNEFGTFQGSFTAPSGVLTGQMQISDSYGSTLISVEEYKRPKFEVKVLPTKGSFRINDQVIAKGEAKAYSGAPIDNAQVKYRVMREARFPWWWWWRCGSFPSSPAMEITSGYAKTNDKGEFDVPFKAIPDASLPKESRPTYTYKVIVDVTDLNGETRSANGVVTVGYVALDLDLEIDERVLIQEKDQVFALKTKNLNGEFEAASGTITLYRLKEATRAYRSRSWERADKQVLSKAEFTSMFPYDVYEDENNSATWERTKIVELKFNSAEKKEVELKELFKSKPGKYVVELKAKDAFGQEVVEYKEFTLYDSKSTSIPVPEENWFHAEKGSGEPGETARIVVGSAYENVHLIYDVLQDGKVLKREYVTLNNSQKGFDIPLLEEYRGNIGVQFAYIRANRVYTNCFTIEVPYSNKQLDITFETFRNKLLPGEKEQWKMKITGPKGDKALSEMVATLYDASLDVFKPHNWYFNPYRYYSQGDLWDSGNSGFGTSNFQQFSVSWNNIYSTHYRTYDRMNWFGYYMNFYHNYYYGSLDDGIALSGNVKRERSLPSKSKAMKKSLDTPAPVSETYKMEGGEMEKEEAAEMDEAVDNLREKKPGAKNGKSENKEEEVQIRKNMQETAFFFPQLQTDEKGSLIINFTIPEALTKWKMMGFSHTKDLKIGSIKNELVTQKELMVVPNAPRFFRENDKITFQTKVTNLSDKKLSGNVTLKLFDAVSMKPLDHLFKGTTGNQTISSSQAIPDNSFTTELGQSTMVEWNLSIPEGVGAITYRVIAKADKFSDGEEMAVPVLTNRMLVTESMPLPIRSKQNKTFVMEKLVKNKSNTLRHHKLTLEFTSQPAWYAIQALPYLMEYPYECAEQTFSRLYANSIASHVVNSDPKIKRVFESWQNVTPDALLSNLEKNQELKAVLLEETPWVREANNESERKRRVAVLFDLNRMSNELDRAIDKLAKMQKAGGAWPWFDGLPEDRYITQHIICGIGHLDKLGVRAVKDDSRLVNMTKEGIRYLDRKIVDEYEELKRLEKKGVIKLSDNNTGYTQIHYLYTRSFFTEPMNSNTKEAFDYYIGQIKKYWLNNSIYMKGMIVLALHRAGDTKVTGDIIKSLKEFSLNNEEMGMYFKEGWGMYWWQAPIETQALMIEVFDEVAKDQKSVDDLKVWLLKQKQTTDWKTTKATADACYALLLKGTNWLASDDMVEIQVGDKKIDPKNMPDVKVEAGTGYFKTSWNGSEIDQEMGKVKVHKKDDGVSWGALYWQYFEQLDKITPHETPLKIKKELFVQENSPTGPVLRPIKEGTEVKVGDLVKVRIELRVDRNMEYVHMKDMRAAGFEPINVLSGGKYQDGLYYYESTRDAATNFFFHYLPKGTYVFEYPLRVFHKGDFSNGITTVQCMYAPEFTSHSEGVRVEVK